MKNFQKIKLESFTINDNYERNSAFTNDSQLSIVSHLDWRKLNFTLFTE